MFSKTLKNGKEDFLDQNLDKLIFGLQLTIKYRKIEVKITYKMSQCHCIHRNTHLLFSQSSKKPKLNQRVLEN